MAAWRSALGNWRRPEVLLIVMSAVVPLSFSTWQALLNNFAVERAQFTGVEIGVLQSLREVPGFLAFAVVFVLLLMREQTLAFVSLCLLGLGTALTGLFPTVVGLYATTVLMSLGFHYFETVRQSLALQWVAKDRAAHFLGRMIGVGSAGSLVAFALVYLALDLGGLDMAVIYLLGGGLTVGLTLGAWAVFGRFSGTVEQRKRLVFRRRYWLYYVLVFLSGARRQIFMVFAGFLMVEKFGFEAAEITLMFLVNGAITVFAAPAIGRLIGRIGERRSLMLEYAGLIVVFLGYAFVDAAWVAVALYLLDHAFFAMAIATKTYFQKIADPADIAATAGVAFSINHVAAVVIPVLFGFLWIVSPAAVFLAGAAIAAASLLCAFLVPAVPGPDNVAVLMGGRASAGAAE